MSEFRRFKTQLNSDSRLYLGYSGGLDSTVLLHLLANDSTLKDSVYALHVNHQLQTDSCHWAEHCAATCKQLQVPFQSLTIKMPETRRQGIESVARKRRYAAMNDQLTEGDILLTAHHQRDQAETFLLNLSRGAGVHGLSAMPECKTIDLSSGRTATHKRPLLKVPYQELLAYAEAMKLTWINDPSNENCDFRRNLVRHRILPEFEQAWPNINQQITRSAELMQEAQVLIDKNARTQLQQGHFDQFHIDLNCFENLDWIELKNVMRFWARQMAGFQLGFQPLEWIHEHLCEKNGARGMLKLPTGELRLYRKKLYYLKDSLKEYQLNFKDLINFFALDSRPIDQHQKRCFELKLPHSWLIENQDQLTLCSLQAAPDINRIKLKKWFQSQGVPQWKRDYWPVLVLKGKLVAVWGKQDSFVQTLLEPADAITLTLCDEQIHLLSIGHSMTAVKSLESADGVPKIIK